MSGKNRIEVCSHLVTAVFSGTASYQRIITLYRYRQFSAGEESPFYIPCQCGNNFRFWFAINTRGRLCVEWMCTFCSDVQRTWFVVIWYIQCDACKSQSRYCTNHRRDSQCQSSGYGLQVVVGRMTSLLLNPTCSLSVDGATGYLECTFCDSARREF